MSRNWSRILDIVGNMVTVLAIIAAVAIFGLRAAGNRPRDMPARIQLKNDSVRSWVPGSRTLILFLSTTCSVCREEAPYYAGLQQEARRHPNRIRVVAVFPEDQSAVTPFMQDAGLDFPTFTGVRLSDLKISRTPMLALCDEEGRVLHAWMGKLSAISRITVRHRVFGWRP